jgi:hypothetical protein
LAEISEKTQGDSVQPPRELARIIAMTTTASPPPASFWARRIVAPLRAQLTQGVTPERLAFTLSVGTACSLLPFLGFTSLLNLGVGLALRLNQPVLQTLNQLLGPGQIALILGYVRVGEWIWQAPAMPLSPATLVNTFRADPAAFLVRFGWTGVHAATAWALSVPFIIVAIYFPLRSILCRLSSRR